MSDIERHNFTFDFTSDVPRGPKDPESDGIYSLWGSAYLDGNNVGLVEAWIVDRPAIVRNWNAYTQTFANFHLELDEISIDLRNLSWDLFDSRGKLRAPFYRTGNPLRKGSGVWGEELDHGMIVLIYNFLVFQQYRRMGVGSELVRGIIGLARKEVCQSEQLVSWCAH